MLQPNRTAYTPTGSGFSLSLLKLFRLKFSFRHLPMGTRTWAGINSSVKSLSEAFQDVSQHHQRIMSERSWYLPREDSAPVNKKDAAAGRSCLYAIHWALKLCVSTWCEHFTHPAQSALPSNSAYHCLFFILGHGRGEVTCPATKSVRSRGEICNLGSTYADY